LNTETLASRGVRLSRREQRFEEAKECVGGSICFRLRDVNDLNHIRMCRQARSSLAPLTTVFIVPKNTGMAPTDNRYTHQPF